MDILHKEELIALGESITGVDVGRPGPKAQQIRFNKDRKKVLAIDIGGSKIRILISDLEGNLIANLTGATPLKEGRKSILNFIGNLVNQTLTENNLTLIDIGSIVVGTPGTVDPKNGIITRSYNLPDWENFSLSHELSLIFNQEVQVENEAHLAIYGENWRGSAKKLSNAATMSIGVGIGLGLLINGQVYRGFNGIAGEVGNLPIQLDDSSDSPMRANFEFSASAVGLERKFEAVKSSPEAKNILNSVKNEETITAKIIYNAAMNGDEFAIKLVNEQLELLGRGIGAICCVTNPEVFILAGGLAPALKQNLDKLTEVVSRYTLIPPRIKISELGDLATAYGALRRGIENIDRSTLISILKESA